MSATIAQALTRHVLTAFGGAAAARYGIEGDAFDAIVGAVALLIGTAWSIVEKRKRGE